MSQAGNDSNNLTKFRSNIINVKFPGQMAINQYSKIFYVFFAFQRSECISIVIYYSEVSVLVLLSITANLARSGTLISLIYTVKDSCSA